MIYSEATAPPVFPSVETSIASTSCSSHWRRMMREAHVISAVQNSDVKPMVIDRCGTVTNSEVEPLLERLEWAGRPQQAVAQIEFDATRRAIVMQPMRQVEFGIMT